jgi:hypothetical protein
MNWFLVPLLPEQTEENASMSEKTRELWNHLAMTFLEPLGAHDRVSVVKSGTVVEHIKESWLANRNFALEMEQAAMEAAKGPAENILAAFTAMETTAVAGPGNALVVVGYEGWLEDYPARCCRDMLRLAHRRPWPGKMVQVLAMEDFHGPGKRPKFRRNSWNYLVSGAIGYPEPSALNSSDTRNGNWVAPDADNFLPELHRMILPHLSTQVALECEPAGRWRWSGKPAIEPVSSPGSSVNLSSSSPLVFEAVAGFRYRLHLRSPDEQPDANTTFALKILNPVYSNSTDWPDSSGDKQLLKLAFKNSHTPNP